MTLKGEHDALKRRVPAAIADALMADPEYKDVYVSMLHARDMSGPTGLPGPKEPSLAEDEEKDQEEEPYGRYSEEYGVLQAALQAMRASNPMADLDKFTQAFVGDLGTQLGEAQTRLAEKFNENGQTGPSPDEHRATQDTDYLRCFMATRYENLSRAIANTLPGPPPSEDVKQLATAFELQKKWLTSCKDWETRHAYEINFESKNWRLKRWLRRIKPYRYAEEK